MKLLAILFALILAGPVLAQEEPGKGVNEGVPSKGYSACFETPAGNESTGTVLPEAL